MDKRYQVFISSTYADLKDERQNVMKTLMEMDCIPSGMELFPASDEEQFEFIKRVIDDCDYYLLVIGGRYGSTTAEGISYTEKEFDYAVEKGIKVIAFLHGDPQAISVGKTDNNPDLAKRLTAFREKAQTSRLVKFWQKAEELPGLVALSLLKTIKTYPAVGWVRASHSNPTELLEEINALRKENAALSSAVKTNQAPISVPSDLADMEETLIVSGVCVQYHSNSLTKWQHSLSWSTLFALIAPDLLMPQNDSDVESVLSRELLKLVNPNAFFISHQLDHQIFQTIKIQLQVYGLVKTEIQKFDAGTSSLMWSLTEKGHAEMMRLRTVRTQN